MAKAVIILTCFNRKEKTIKCIKSIIEGNYETDFKWVIVDDNSSDGTVDALKEIVTDAHILIGDGKLFWNGGMHKGMKYAHENIDADYYVMINDDVEFVPGVFDKMATKLGESEYVLVGATQWYEGGLSYGGIKYGEGGRLKFRMVGPGERGVECDTFNANCVFIPRNIFLKAGATDPHYTHSLGDFDYGFAIRRMGYTIYVYDEFVGKCNDNSTEGTWQDASLPVGKRLKLKEGPKGLPFKDWYRYLRKNFGIGVAVTRSITPYIKILLRR